MIRRSETRLWTSGILLALLAGCAALDPRPRAAEEFDPEDPYHVTLRWEAFPRAGDYGEVRDRMTNITYEIRVWTNCGGFQPSRIAMGSDSSASSGFPGDLVYSEDKLPDPVHRISRRLEPNTSYIWTVRARFTLDGKPRVSPWSGADSWSRLGVVPNGSYYSFRTLPLENP